MPGARHHLRLQRGAAQDAGPCRAGYRAARSASPAARSTASCSVAKSVGYLTDFPETIDFETAMRLPPARGDDHRHRRAGREPRRARPDRLRPAQARARSPAISSSSRPSRSPATRSRSAASRTSSPRSGIEMITDRQAPVHVSGHPGRPELAAMYDWIRPEIIVPVHGEMRHMMEQARFAQARGIPHGIVQKNGDLVRLAPERPGEDRRGAGRPADPRRRRHPPRRRRAR